METDGIAVRDSFDNLSPPKKMAFFGGDCIGGQFSLCAGNYILFTILLLYALS